MEPTMYVVHGHNYISNGDGGLGWKPGDVVSADQLAPPGPGQAALIQRLLDLRVMSVVGGP